MNNLFYEILRQANEGMFVGLSTSLPVLDEKIGGLGRKMLIPVIADSKVGKSSLVDAALVIEPYLDSITKDVLFTVDYFSYEMDLVTKMYKFVAYFFMRDFKIMSFEHKGKRLKISESYLLGKMIDEEGEAIKIKEEHFPIISEIYETRILPMFGEYDISGKLIKRGCIRFHMDRQTPTAMMQTVYNSAKALGSFYEDGMRVSPTNVIDGNTKYFYDPHEPTSIHVVVTDHTRKVSKEDGKSLKQTMDDWGDWMVKLRNQLGFSFVPICHTNRDMINIHNIVHRKAYLYPTGDDSKDSGNFVEDCNVLISLFNPFEPKYNITTHFGVPMIGQTCPIPEEIRPMYRTMHIVANRSGEAPVHTAMLVNGANSTVRQYGRLEGEMLTLTQKIDFVRPEYGEIGGLDRILKEYNDPDRIQMNRNEFDPILSYDLEHPLAHPKRYPVIPERMYTPTEVDALRTGTDYINPIHEEEHIYKSVFGGNIYQSDLDKLPENRYHIEDTTLYVKPYWLPDNYVYNSRWRDGKKPYFIRPETIEELGAEGGILRVPDAPRNMNDFSLDYNPLVEKPQVDNPNFNLF